jgi:hypothetical protein
MTALTLLPDAELTYNPTIASGINIAPQVWIGDHLHFGASVAAFGEWTEADSTTYAGEVLLSDLRLSAGLANLFTMPWLGISYSANAFAALPTSKGSQAATSIGSVGASLSLSRAFQIPYTAAAGLSYQLRADRFFHRYTPGERATSVLEGRCVGATEYCGIYASTGVRNVEWSLRHRVSASISPFQWLGASVSGGISKQFLYASKFQDDVYISYQPTNPTGLPDAGADTRYGLSVVTALFVTPHPAVTVTVGTATNHGQLGADGRYRTPGFNRFTEIYSDVSLNIDGVASVFLD